MTCRCIHFLASFNLSGRALSDVTSSGIKLDADTECENATTGYLEC